MYLKSSHNTDKKSYGLDRYIVNMIIYNLSLLKIKVGFFKK